MSKNMILAAAVALAATVGGGAATKDEAWLLQTNLLEKVSSAKARQPNVLILGDSISLGYTPAVKAKLAGKANVSRPSCNCGPSQFYLQHMRSWAGTNRWDVIHVNFGIWDNHYLKGPSSGMGLYWGREVTNALPPVAKGTAIRDLGFRIRTPIKDYERNLRTILTFLRSRADAVVFGLTTPLTGWEKDDRCGRIRVYNELATEVCKELGVAVDDLYAVAERHLDCQTDGCHFNAKGYGFLADSVAASVLAALAAKDAQGSDGPRRKNAGIGADEYDEPVRPVGVNGQPAWNVAAKQFMYAPTFGFKTVAGAVRYRFTVEGKGVKRTFEAERPTAALTPVWSAIPVGDVTVTATGLAEDGKALGEAGTRRFWKMPPFRKGAYPKAVRGYGETARMIWKYVFNRPYLEYMLEKGEPDPSYPLNSYPSKMLASQIWAMLRYAKLSPADAPRAMKIAKAAADRLIARAQPKGSPLEYFPPTYDGRGEAGNDYVGEKFKGLHMLHYPSAAGEALLDYAAASGEKSYRDFALGIADTYVKLQGADGTWWLKMDERDGKPVCQNRLVPIRVLTFLERVAKLTGEDKYRRAAERAFGFIEKGPLTDWNWEGQFEDIYPAPLYANLSKHGACDVAIYLLKRFLGDKRRLAQARELLRWSEDQFVVWDGRYNRKDIARWTTPVALEQYHCYCPIDESAAKLVMTYLALYRAERNPRDLAKARALGDAFTRVTLDDGRLRTYWNTDSRANEHEDWVNGQVVSALALEDLATFDKE